MAFLFHDIVLDDTAFKTASDDMASLKQQAANLKTKLEKMYEDVTSALHLPDGVTAQYVDYDVVDQYPDDSSTDIFVMKAVENSKLLIVKFNISNTTSQDISINIMSSVQKFKGIVNDAKKYNAQLTLLLDALNT